MHIIQKLGALVFTALMGMTGSGHAQTTGTEPSLTYHADVVVVGAGGAGLSAAVRAAEEGARVIVLEKMPMIGGNTVQSAGFMLAVPPQVRDKEERETIHTKLLGDMLQEGGADANRERIEHMLDRSDRAVSWLRKQGADLEATQDYSNLHYPVAFHPIAGSYTVGEEIIKALVHSAETLNIPMLTLTHVTKLLLDNEGTATGVQAITSDGRKIEVQAAAVVIASGGFAENRQLLEKYVKLPFPMSSTNLPGTTGDGIEMALGVGADLVAMNHVMIHLTTMPFSGLLMPVQARSAGGILINSQGQRFTDELSHDVAPFYQRADGHAWLILDQKIIDRYPVLRNYAQLGFMIKGRTEEELARMIRVSPQQLYEELQRYRVDVSQHEDPVFHRATLASALNHYPLYAVNVEPGLQSTLGGIRTDLTTRVLRPNRTPIPGLYAVGEVAGGIFGSRRIEGSGLTASIVFGMIGGEQAAHYAKTNPRRTLPKAMEVRSEPPVTPVHIQPSTLANNPPEVKVPTDATPSTPKTGS